MIGETILHYKILKKIGKVRLIPILPEWTKLRTNLNVILIKANRV
jgi:hypothetical protein